MRVIIPGGASFLGYWVKDEFKEQNKNSISQVIDAPRKGLPLIKKDKDEFIHLNFLKREDLLKFSPSIIVINLYDLLSRVIKKGLEYQ
ncbi:hypothetical protein [Halalkalibacter alkalisediminis]|uniref:Uncharacterized protein n=1 Tax=Halalkalibacter alkalisediminis TaxID=935616 RepID=A0ABV6NKT1_9BACI|nr:hypothetical protein [Halalkalibacter alkalisediminis]